MMARLLQSLHPVGAVLIVIALAAALVAILMVASRYPDDDGDGNW